jgi:hypothetical protein
LRDGRARSRAERRHSRAGGHSGGRRRATDIEHDCRDAFASMCGDDFTQIAGRIDLHVADT